MKTKENFYSTKKKEARKLMMRLSKPIRDRKGKIIKCAQFQNDKAGIGKVHADRKWFSATRTIAKEDIDKLANKERELSPFDVLLSKQMLPFGLLKNKETKIKKKVNFQEVYTKQSKKVKPNFDKFLLNKESTLEKVKTEVRNENNTDSDADMDDTIQRGQSKRIWKELFKVIDCSDVVIHVLDSRDPLNTKCDLIEKYVVEKNKKLIFVINKVDLVPFKNSMEWQKIISKKHPCLLFHANSINNTYGKMNLIGLLKQFKKMNDKEISVGFVGYPNIGKSSIINALLKRDACNVAPIPGETKYYQYLTLTKQINLIDSPGVIPVISTEQAVLKGAVRIENVKDPETYVELIFNNHKASMENVYGIKADTCETFIELFSKSYGKVMKGGVYNHECSARIILSDFIRGKIPFFSEPNDKFYKI